MADARPVGVQARGAVEEQAVEGLVAALRQCAEMFPVLPAAEHSGDVRHYAQRLVMVGVHNGVEIAEYECVILASRPVNYVPELPALEVDAPEEVIRAFSEPCGNQPRVLAKVRQSLGFEVIVALFDKGAVARVHIVVPGHYQALEYPFSGPGGVVNEVAYAVTGEAVLRVNGVVGKLVDYRVGFVWDSLPVAVHICSAERGCFDGVATELPNCIQNAV